MAGWITDFLLFWWALLFWNLRKTWFRLRGPTRDSCPCQVFSDSGHALDSRCSAVINWRQPARFRRVCPLLTETGDGWRCCVDAERVRPFWGRAAAYLGGGLLALYLAGTLGVYALLRGADYQLDYLTVAWPPRWSELRGSQERLYAARAQQALASGNYAEAMLALQMVSEINPRNYPAAITLATLSQVAGQPFVAEHIFARLMHDVPDQRPATAQIWVRSLLARGDYAQVKPLATAMLTEDSGQREAWLHALIFACRQDPDTATLERILHEQAGLPEWCLEVVQLELLRLQRRTDQLLPALNRVHGRPGSPYLPYFQSLTLIELGRYAQAAELISAYGIRLPRAEAAFLRLRLFAAQQWHSLMGPEYDDLLAFPMTPRLAAQFCAWFVHYPDPAAFARFADRFTNLGPPRSADTLPLFHAAYLAAVCSRDTTRADFFAAEIRRLTSADARALRTLGELLAQGGNAHTQAQLLPLVPLPIEVIYAIFDHPQHSAPRP